MQNLENAQSNEALKFNELTNPDHVGIEQAFETTDHLSRNDMREEYVKVMERMHEKPEQEWPILDATIDIIKEAQKWFHGQVKEWFAPESKWSGSQDRENFKHQLSARNKSHIESEGVDTPEKVADLLFGIFGEWFLTLDLENTNDPQSVVRNKIKELAQRVVNPEKSRTDVKWNKE